MWRGLLEQQNQNFLVIIEAMKDSRPQLPTAKPSSVSTAEASDSTQGTTKTNEKATSVPASSAEKRVDVCEVTAPCGTLRHSGDSGYAQRPYMMTPILGAEENSPEGHYNKLHATARNTVERTFSVLKGRFRCLLVHRVLHYHPDTVAKIVIACCVLHNICNRAGLSAVQMSQAEIDGEHEFINNVQRRQPVDQPSQ
ncbi:hypothetical protein evm_002175 [Chilo suppressalis]|nr:hypothetical protein evm_002175 [Chilo suppressalis]